MSPSRRDTLKAVGAAGVLAILGSHTVGAQDDDNAIDAISNDEAAVRVAHLSPDAPNVDVFVDDDEVLSDVAFGDVSDYLILDAGTYEVRITAADDPDTVAFEGDVAFDETFYTVAAIGELGEDTFEPLVLEDYDVAQVRLVHASPDAPAVDVTVEDTDLTLFENVGFGEDTEYVAVPRGAYTLEVRGASDDTDDEDEGDADGDVVATFDVELAAGTAYSAHAVGYLEPKEGEEEFDLVITLDGVTTEDAPEDDRDFDADDDADDDVDG